MKPWRRALWIAFALLPACVQVLGLEEATPDEPGADLPGKSPVVAARSRLSCDELPGAGCACEQAPVPACTACLQRECDGAELSCLTDSDCRNDLDVYAVCLGRGCGGDQEQEACSSALSEPRLKHCVISCQVECRQTRLVSACELYCACMADFCAGELAAAAISDCMATCESWDADVRDCRREHCDYSLGRQRDHCMHASDRLHACQGQDELPAGSRNVCLDKSESTWACDFDDECCSGGCSDGVCD